VSTDGEVIALVLADGGEPRHAAPVAEGAKRLVRDALGRMSLEEVGSQEEFDRTARQTGCFRRGEAIVDPKTREVIGYEMEEVQIHGPGRA
jgi:hypothetical protein